ncbi:hypothetical protein ACFU9F_00040 [Streptomyces zhihengii]|uniref:hypothetical protein n=1 Tax=Streptomyces zhihengii TaxID=1818004 RepID=UPI00368B9EDC
MSILTTGGRTGQFPEVAHPNDEGGRRGHLARAQHGRGQSTFVDRGDDAGMMRRSGAVAIVGP